MTNDVAELDLLPPAPGRTVAELADLSDQGLARCEYTCNGWTCISTCPFTVLSI